MISYKTPNCYKTHYPIKFIRKPYKLSCVVLLIYFTETLISILFSNQINIPSIKRALRPKYAVFKIINNIVSIEKLLINIFDINDKISVFINMFIYLIVLILFIELLCSISYSGLIKFFSIIYGVLMILIYVKKQKQNSKNKDKNKNSPFNNQLNMILFQMGLYYFIPENSSYYVPPCCKFKKYKFIMISIFLLLLSVLIFINSLIDDNEINDPKSEIKNAIKVN